MERKKEKCNKISIYLIKPYNNIENLIKDELSNRVKELQHSDSYTCITYYMESYLNKPNWLSTYYKIGNTDLIQSNAKVISFHKLIIDGEKVIFAIPFGNGKSLLKDDVTEEQFGLKVLLNSINSKSFRQVQMVNCGKNFKTSSEQIPKISSLDEFVFDINIDLMKKAVAKCEDEEFYGNMVTGGDLLSVSAPYDITNIDFFLEFCYRRYKEKKYLINFSWIDNIKEVKSKSERENLNKEMVKKINDRQFDEVWMAVPENIKWEEVSCFKFYKSDLGWDDIEISEFIKKFSNDTIASMSQIKNKSVYAISTDGEVSYTWSAYKCLMAEIQYNNNAYCYNGGKWYKINNTFSSEIEQNYEQLQIFNRDFPKCSNIIEKEYNELLNKTINESYLMDCNLIETGGSGHSRIELCDILTEEKELIHIKRGESSSYLSHLFNQARVSSDFIMDLNFRLKVNEKIGKQYFSSKFTPSDYTIVFGIITNRNIERPKIPFFSKVTIKYAVDELERKGYKVKIKNIYCE